MPEGSALLDYLSVVNPRIPDLEGRWVEFEYGNPASDAWNWGGGLVTEVSREDWGYFLMVSNHDVNRRWKLTAQDRAIQKKGYNPVVRVREMDDGSTAVDGVLMEVEFDV